MNVEEQVDRLLQTNVEDKVVKKRFKFNKRNFFIGLGSFVISALLMTLLVLPVSREWMQETFFGAEEKPLSPLRGSWWNADWSYAKNITIADKVDDYQMKLIVGKSAGGNVTTEGHCNDNFSDLRFVYNNATELPYWIENFTSATQATVWINNSGNYSYFEMFYGNSAVGNNSDGNATFLLFDDFGTDNHAGANGWDTNLWGFTVYSGSSFTNNTDDLQIDAPNTVGNIGLYSINSYGWSSVACTIRAKCPIGADENPNQPISYGFCAGGTIAWGSSNRATIALQGGAGDVIKLVTYDGAAVEDIMLTDPGMNWVTSYHLYTIYENKTNEYKGELDYGVYSSSWHTEAAFVDYVIPARIRGTTYTATTSNFDWVYVRNFTTIEPSFSAFGSEQSSGVWSNSIPVNSNPVPGNGNTSISLNPELRITVSDANVGQNQSLNVTFRTNESGSWVTLGTNNSVTNGTYINYHLNTSYGTKYYWSVNTSDGVIGSNAGWDNDTYSFTTRANPPSSSGQGITISSMLSYDGSIVSTEFDFLNDTANYTLLVETFSESSGWKGAGSGSFVKNGTDYYLSGRLRTGDTDRGNYIYIKKCTSDPTSADNWIEIMNVSKSDISNVPVGDIGSFERNCLRYWNNSYYFYFCKRNVSATVWLSFYIKNPIAENLENQIKDGNNWVQLEESSYPGDRFKDPWVGYYRGWYYWLFGCYRGEATHHVKLFKSDNPEGNNLQHIYDIEKLYHDVYGTPTGYSTTGCISYDNNTGYFIYWANANHQNNGDYSTYWWWTVASDINGTWSYTNRQLVNGSWALANANNRYMDYYSVSETKYYMIMEYDIDGDEDKEHILWNYGVHVPTQSGEVPANQSTGISLNPRLVINATDDDGDWLNVTFRTNATGSWGTIGTNTTHGSHWVNQTNSSFNAYSTKYWWSVNISDGTGSDDCNATYHFTTEAVASWQSVADANGSYINTTVLRSILDANGSYSNTTLLKNILDANGSYINTTIIRSILESNGSYINTTRIQSILDANGSYVNTTIQREIVTANGSYSNTSVTTWQNIAEANGSYVNTTVQREIITANGSYVNTTVMRNILEANGSYTNDSLVWYSVITSNGSYYNSSVPVLDVTNEYPSNNSNILVVQPTVYFNVTSPQGRKMNYSLYIHNTTLIAIGKNVDNGTQGLGLGNHSYTTAVNYTTYFWRVMLSDGHGNWVNETYDFKQYVERTVMTPGFEILVFMLSVLMCLYILKRRKKNV